MDVYVKVLLTFIVVAVIPAIPIGWKSLFTEGGGVFYEESPWTLPYVFNSLGFAICLSILMIW